MDIPGLYVLMQAWFTCTGLRYVGGLLSLAVQQNNSQMYASTAVNNDSPGIYVNQTS
jgi:hypothetical protein